MERLPLKVLMDSARDALNIMLLELDLPNGEQFSRSPQMDAQPKLLSKRPLAHLQDMDLSANKTVLFQLLSQKFFKMDHTVLRYQLKSPKEYYLLSWLNFSINIFSSRVFY